MLANYVSVRIVSVKSVELWQR